MQVDRLNKRNHGASCKLAGYCVKVHAVPHQRCPAQARGSLPRDHRRCSAAVKTRDPSTASCMQHQDSTCVPGPTVEGQTYFVGQLERYSIHETTVTADHLTFYLPGLRDRTASRREAQQRSEGQRCMAQPEKLSGLRLDDPSGHCGKKQEADVWVRSSQRGSSSSAVHCDHLYMQFIR